MRAGHQKDQALTRSLAFSALPPDSLEKEERLEVELLIDRAYVMESLCFFFLCKPWFLFVYCLLAYMAF